MAEPQAARLRTRSLALAAVGAALALELAAILWLDEGRFVYTLDDPYIHLALAAQLRQGHYGINAGEFAAPSSSALWPFLLAPFGDLAALEYLPLALNALLCLATGGLYARIASRALGAGEALHGGALLCALALVGITNTVGLAYTGMEHSLQLWLAVASLWGTWRALDEGRAPAWLWAALAVAPWVRYESAALCVPLWIVLARRGQLRGVLISAAAAGLPLVGFSAFLHALELPFVPTSVLVKAGADSASFGVLQHLARNLGQVHAWILLGWALVLGAGLGSRAALASQRRELCAAALAALALHLALGRLGWFSRYEMYVLAAAACAALLAFGSRAAAWLERRRAVVLPALAALAAVHFPHVGATLLTPLASNNIFEQQYQMRRFAREVLPSARVAVRDLGWVAFRSPTYTLDLNGLASLAALRALRSEPKAPDWVDALLREHGIALGILPEGYGARHARAGWVLLGTLRLSRPRITPAAPAVSFYALDPETAALARQALPRFVSGLPARLQLEPPVQGPSAGPVGSSPAAAGVPAEPALAPEPAAKLSAKAAAIASASKAKQVQA